MTSERNPDIFSRGCDRVKFLSGESGVKFKIIVARLLLLAHHRRPFFRRLYARPIKRRPGGVKSRANDRTVAKPGAQFQMLGMTQHSTNGGNSIDRKQHEYFLH